MLFNLRFYSVTPYYGPDLGQRCLTQTQKSSLSSLKLISDEKQWNLLKV